MSSSSPQPPAPSTVQRSSVTKWIIIFILRIVVLSGFGAGAIALGILAGHFTPSSNPKEPLLMRLFQKPTITVKVPKPELNQKVVSLSAEEKAAIEQEILGIQEQVQILTARTEQLETELDLDLQQEGNLANRLTNLSELLAQDPEEFEPTTATPANTTEEDGLKITLPSNILFAEGGQLADGAEDILEAIAIDLQESRSRTIKIAGYSLAQGDFSADELSFQQAQSVKLYLDSQIAGDYRWLVIGYGAIQPEGGPAAGQRIEITAEK